MLVPALRTERLTLRGFEESDLDAWAAIVGDPETARFVGGVASREEAWMRIARYLGHWVLRGYGQWAVVEGASGRLVVGAAGDECDDRHRRHQPP